MGADRNARILQDPVVLLNRRVINRHAGVIDDLVHDTKGVRLRGPHEVLDRPLHVPLARGVDLVDRDHLSGFWLRREVFIMKPPPRGRVAAEALALVFGIGAGPRADVDDADLEDIAGLGSADVHGPGADVHAEALARAPAEQRRLHRPRTPPIDTLALLVPVEDALGARITLDHPLGIVVGVVREGLDRHEVAGVDLDGGLERLAEISAVHRLVGRRHVIVILGAWHHSGLRLGRSDSHRQRRRHSADRERTLEEVPPSFAPPRVGLLIARTSRVLSLSDIGRHARFLPRVSTTPVASSAYRTIHGVSRRFKWDLRYGICDMERFYGPCHVSLRRWWL